MLSSAGMAYNLVFGDRGAAVKPAGIYQPQHKSKCLHRASAFFFYAALICHNMFLRPVKKKKKKHAIASTPAARDSFNL